MPTPPYSSFMSHWKGGKNLTHTCKTSPELLAAYKKVLKDKGVEINGVRWPIDTLITGTSNIKREVEMTSVNVEMNVAAFQEINDYDAFVIVGDPTSEVRGTVRGVPIILLEDFHAIARRSLEISKAIHILGYGDSMA